MTNDEDIFSVAGKTCELLLCFDDKEKGTGNWLLSAFHWATGGELKGVQTLASFESFDAGRREIDKLLAHGH